MKNIIFLLCVLFFSIVAPAQIESTVQGQASSSYGDDYDSGRIRPYKRTHIKSVKINENAAWSPTQDPARIAVFKDACSNFILTEADVKDYFRRATQISGTEHVNLNVSGCYASGDITFENGDHGEWVIDRFRGGYIILSDGRWLYFVGKNVRAKVFYEYVDDSHQPMGKPDPPIKLGPIKSITFRKDFRWDVSEEQAEGKCHFKLSESDVRDYFLKAKVISNETRLDIVFGKGQPRRIPALTGCQVEGDIEFVDGRKGSWVIENNRTGVLEIYRGGRAYLYAKGAKASAFSKP